MWLLCGCCLFCGVGCFDALVVDGFGGLGFWGLTPGLRECWVECYVFGWFDCLVVGCWIAGWLCCAVGVAWAGCLWAFLLLGFLVWVVSVLDLDFGSEFGCIWCLRVV